MINRFSIIIPVLNEAENIGGLLHYLVENSKTSQNIEIIVVDGGSADGTQELVTSLDLNVILLKSEKGRAKQMNLGAEQASGSILYFLHADSFPPKYFEALIISEIKKGNKAGCFRMQFDSNHWWLCFASWLTQFNWKACRGGDQSLFITKHLFDTIGGYDENYGIYEDNMLIQELYRLKEFTVINKTLLTSARMYKKYGVWKVQYHYLIIYFKKWFGASAEDLLVYYKKHLTD